MAYVAIRPLTLAGGEIRQPGELVPEAPAWEQLKRLVRHGFLAPVEDGKELAFAEALCRGELPVHLCPALGEVKLARVARRMRGGTPPASLMHAEPPSKASRKAKKDG